MNDLTIRSVGFCTPAQCQTAARRTAGLAVRAGVPAAELAEVLAALGLLDAGQALSVATRQAIQPPAPGTEDVSPAASDPGTEVLCRCPGRKHTLTPESSESTYVDPRGQRLCRVGIERRRQARNLDGDHQDVTEETVPPVFAPPRAGGPDPDLLPCRCPDETHWMTPHDSPSTYVDPHGGRQCRVARRRAQVARRDKARMARGEAA